MLDFTSPVALRAREPMFFIPGVVLLVAGALSAIHAALTFLGPDAQETAIRELGFMPGRLTIALWPQKLAAFSPARAATPRRSRRQC